MRRSTGLIINTSVVSYSKRANTSLVYYGKFSERSFGTTRLTTTRAGLFHITGTDIVRCLAFRFHAFGRPVKNSKKFEEGIFSDLRNLKAGNDASLEEPKSPFLDFLYKNNCIRTQKKQKVFYWYSVPHDRLFLDALERDLKREKAGQEATTESKAEPSLSFVYDPSRSLYEQLTHSTDQDQNEQNIAGVSHSRSPSVAPATASYVGPQLQAQRTVSSAREYASSDAFNDRSTSSQIMPTVQMPPIMENQMMMPTSTETMKSDQAYNAMSYAPLNNSNMQMSYDQIATVYQQQPPMSQMQRHSSMTNFYMEPSPAPSFASANSYYDDQSRAVSYEPITPPQYGYNYTNEPTYAHGDNAYHSNGHDMQNVQQNMPQYSTTMPPPPPPRFSSVPRQFPSAATQYSHIEGSPMYKQRRRGSSMAGSYGPAYPQVQAQMPAQMPSQMAPPIYAQMPQQMRQMHASQYAVRHSSDLRRSVSASVVPNGQLYERSASNPPPGSHAYMTQLRQSQTPDRSRQSSPLASIETQQPMHLMRDRYAGLMHDGSHVATQSRQSSPGPVVIRRARSATADTDPYPQKTHTCPIPSCGRDFRRLEHLKRHVRTHTQEKPYQCAHCDKTFSRSDNLAQ